MTTKAAQNVVVEVGDLVFHGDVESVPRKAPQTCPHDGVLDMDVVRRCLLVFDGATFAARCRQGA